MHPAQVERVSGTSLAGARGYQAFGEWSGIGPANRGVGTLGGCNVPCFRKHDRQSTGLPCVGLNGTVVSSPHSEHVVLVSDRAVRPPLVLFALHCLQRLGSFLNLLS